MKLLLAACLFFLVSACQENVPSYNDLTANEQGYIRDLAGNNCRSDCLSDFTDIKATSNVQLAKFERGYYWKIEIPGTTVLDYLYVWKVTGTTVFFLYQQKTGTTTNHYFIKMTPTFNGEMVDDFRIQKCASKIPAITQSSSSFSIKFTDVMSTEGSTKYRTDTTYSGLDTTPAFFSLWSQKIFKEKLDSNSNVTSSENLAYKITYVADNADLLDTYSSYTNIKYCVYKYTNATPKTFIYPFELNCVETSATDPNASLGDANMSFTSADL